MKHGRIVILAILCSLAVPFALAVDDTDQAPQAPQPRPPMYVVKYETGPEYLPGRPFAEQPGLVEHAQYMNELEASGTIVFGGPVFDDLESFIVSGAMLFLKVGSADEARRIAEKDPAITNGFMKIERVEPFMAMIGEF